MFLKKTKPLNYEDRPQGMEPNIILMHYTGMQSMQEAKDRLSDPESKVSAHYLVDEGGKVHNLVPEDKRAWHAGMSYWKRVTDINSASIGIEVVNQGHEFGYREFPIDQMHAVSRLCKKIQKRHNIDYVLAHSDVAPERKQDPGELFDWEGLALEGVGLWPDVTRDDRRDAVSISRNDYECRKKFDFFGYNPMAAYMDVVCAFQRHYCPQVFEEGSPAMPGESCEETVARLLALIRQQARALA